MRREWESLREEILCRHVVLTSKDLPSPSLIAQRMLISAEDRRHGRHPGFDLYAMCRAIWRRATSGRREGASTIEQQIVRVLTNRFEPTLARKIREVLLAALVAELLPKSATPPLYLSIGYYGWRMNGFTQACERLGLREETLSIEDAAGLISRLKYPEPRIAPPSRVAQINRRRTYVLDLFKQHLSDGTYDHLGRGRLDEALPYGSPIVAASNAHT